MASKGRSSVRIKVWSLPGLKRNENSQQPSRGLTVVRAAPATGPGKGGGNKEGHPS